MQTHPASELIIDCDIYPRREVDGDHVFNLMEAIRTGAEMPAIVICKISKRVVDGAHRLTALQRLHGSDCEVECIEKTYKNDAELFLDAIQYNSAHGRHLSRDDRARIADLGDKLGVDESRLAKSLRVSEAVLGGLRAAQDQAKLWPAHKTPTSSPAQSAQARSLATRRRDQEGLATHASSRGEVKRNQYGHRPAVRSDIGKKPATLSGEPNNYSAEIERIKRAHEIVARIEWHDKDKDLPDGLWDAALELRNLLNELLPPEPE